MVLNKTIILIINVFTAQVLFLFHYTYRLKKFRKKIENDISCVLQTY